MHECRRKIPTPPWNMRVPICLQVLRFIVQYRPIPSHETALVVGGWKGVSEVPHLGDKCVYLPCLLPSFPLSHLKIVKSGRRGGFDIV